MKKILAILLAAALLLGSLTTAFAAGPGNADILKEYEALMKGSWELAGDTNYSEYWKGLSTGFTYNPSKHVLFVTATGEVYFAWSVDFSHEVKECAKVSFSADGNYLMLIKEDNGAVYKRK